MHSRAHDRPLKTPIVEPVLLKLGQAVSPPINFGDMTKIRQLKFDVASLNSRRFLRFQKAYTPPANAAKTVLQLCRSCMNTTNDDKSQMGTRLRDSKNKYFLPFQAQFTPLANSTDKLPNYHEPPGKSKVVTKKRAKRKGTTTATVMDEYGYNFHEEENFSITAYAICEEFDLKGMHKGLVSQGLYIPTVLSDDLTDVIHVSAKYPIGDEPREIFFFREGAVVFWNVPYLEIVNVLKFLKEYQDESYTQQDIEEECEYMSYAYIEQGNTRLIRGTVYLGDDPSNRVFEKYAFANALASSVKLGIWETTLEKYVEGIEHITEALKRADDLKLTRAEVMQKTGELFALRHQLNLNSNLLDTPDFYWERERLETLYQKTCDYLSIARRTKVMNEKLTQCCELLDLISTHLTDQHHTRLEWMIIVLIMIEVGFEILHLLERYEIIHS